MTLPEFAGRIVGALDSIGRAKWLVFISDTVVPVPSGGTNTGTTTLEWNSSVAEVQALLDKGRNVTIPSTWVPSDTFAGSMTALNIPTGTTLTINGAFNNGTGAATTRVTITGGGNLVVKGAFITNNVASSIVGYLITASSIDLYNSAAITFNNDVTTTNGNLVLEGNSTVAFNGTTSIAEYLASNGGTVTVNVGGTLTAKNASHSGGGSLTVNVTTVTSLHITGTVGTNVIIEVGAAGTADGYATIGTLASGATLKINNLSGLATKSSVVTNAAQGSTLTITSGALKVDEKLGTNKFTIAQGQKMTFGTNAKAVDAAASLFVDADGNPITDLSNGEIDTTNAVNGESGSAITVTGATGGSLVSDDGVISSDASISQIEQALQSNADGEGDGLTIEDLDTGDDELEIPADTSLTVTGTAAGTIEGDGDLVLASGSGIAQGEDLDLSGMEGEVTFEGEFNVPEGSELKLPSGQDNLPTVTGNGEVVLGGGITTDADYATKLGRTATISGTAEADGDAVEAPLPAAPKVSGTGELKEYTQGDGTDLDHFLTVNNVSSLSIYTINLSTADAPAGSTITLKKSKTGGNDYEVMIGGGKNEPEKWEDAAVDDNAGYRSIVLLVADTIHSIQVIITKDGAAYTYTLTNPNWSGGAS